MTPMTQLSEIVVQHAETSWEALADTMFIKTVEKVLSLGHAESGSTPLVCIYSSENGGVYDLLTQTPSWCSLNDLGGISEPSWTSLDLLCNFILEVCLNLADRIVLTVLASRQDVPNGSGFAVLSALEYEIEAAASSAVYSFIFSLFPRKSLISYNKGFRQLLVTIAGMAAMGRIDPDKQEPCLLY